jgi:hypothetical protein
VGNGTTVATVTGTLNASGLQVSGASVYYSGGTDVAIADGGTNSSAALANDKVMISSGGAIVESATITTTELGLLNGMASVSTGAGDNDKLVTQGYVDDAVAGGVTAWDDIADPDADTTIAMGGFESTISSTLDETNHVVLKIDHTDADVANNTTIFKIQAVDTGDANLTFLEIADTSAGVPRTLFKVGADGDTTILGQITGDDYWLGDEDYVGISGGVKLLFRSTSDTIFVDDGSLVIGQKDEVTVDGDDPHFRIVSDADSDGAALTEDVFEISMTAAADPTAATWNFTSTQSAGYTFDKKVTVPTVVPTAVTTGNVPYKAATGFADSPAWTDGTDVAIGTTTPTASLDIVKIGGADNADLFLRTYEAGSARYSRLRFRKSHSDVLADVETVLNEYLGIIQFEGENSTPTFAAGSRIYAKQSAASGEQVPAKLYLEAGDALGQFPNQFVVTDDRKIGVNTATPAAALDVQGDAHTALTGTVTMTNASATVEGVGTAFTTELTAGDSVRVWSDGSLMVTYEIFTVQNITDNDTLTLDSNYVGATTGGLTMYKDSNLLRLANGDGVTKLTVNKDGKISAPTTDLTGVTDGNIPYMAAAATGFADSPISRVGAKTIAIGGLNMIQSSETVADDGTVALATGVTGWGFVQAGDNEQWIQFAFTAAGAVSIIANSALGVNTDSDGCLCVYDGGDGIVIKNRLGGSKTVRYVIYYS